MFLLKKENFALFTNIGTMPNSSNKTNFGTINSFFLLKKMFTVN